MVRIVRWLWRSVSLLIGGNHLIEGGRKSLGSPAVLGGAGAFQFDDLK